MVREGIGVAPTLVECGDRSLQQEQDERHVDHGDREPAEPSEALGATARPPDDARCHPVAGEEPEGRSHPGGDGEAEQHHEREERRDGLEAERAQLPGAPEPLLGERALECLGGRLRGLRHGHE